MKQKKSWKMAGCLLLAAALVVSAGCGSGKSSSTASGSTGSPLTVNGEKAEQKETEKQKPTEKESKKEETTKKQESAVTVDRTMLETANTNRQSYRGQMAFDGDYMYFHSGYDLYRCRYDGSDVQKLEIDLDDIIVAEGKLWGFRSGDVTKPGAIYSMDLSTCAMTQVTETAGGVASILVKGNWMCYVGDNGTALIVRNLDSGEEKTISQYSLYKSGGLYDISMCIYGDTLYALINNSGIYALCTYILGSDADSMTVVVQDLKMQMDDQDGFVPIWMEDGLLLLSYEWGIGQYSYAKFADLEKDGSIDYYNKDIRIGTKDERYILNDINQPRFVLGNDLVLPASKSIKYYKGFDLSEEQKIWEGKNTESTYELRMGMHDGSLYYYDENTSEILKISEGGAVEHIPVTIPES